MFLSSYQRLILHQAPPIRTCDPCLYVKISIVNMYLESFLFWNRFEVLASALSEYVFYRQLCLLNQDCLQVLTRSLPFTLYRSGCFCLIYFIYNHSRLPSLVTVIITCTARAGTNICMSTTL